jgi:Integrase core domain
VRALSPKPVALSVGRSPTENERPPLGLKQPRRYEPSRPGELLHIDVKRLGRIEGGAGKRGFGSERRRRHNPTRTDLEGKRRDYVGCEYVHVCVDDYSRLAYAEVLADQRTTTAIGFLKRAVAFYRRRGIRVERLQRLGLRLRPARARLPQTRDPPQPHPSLPAADERVKAERFIRTLLAGWAYGALYGSSEERTQALDAGSGTTTIDADTQLSAAGRPSAEPTCSGLTPRNG